MSEKSLVPYVLPEIEGLSSNFLESMNIDEIEEGIKRADVGASFLILVQGIGIVKIEREGLWGQAGYKSLQDYRVDQNKRLNLSRAGVSIRRRIGETWLDVKAVRSIPIEGNVSKLRIFHQAMKRHELPEILKHYKDDSFIEFENFALGGGYEEITYPEVSIRFAKGEFSVNGKPVLKIEDTEESEFVGEVLKRAYKAREGGRYPHVVSVYGEGEARAVDGFLKKFRAKK